MSFKLIAITEPDYLSDEAGKIEALLNSGFDRVHIRKPGWSANQVRQLLDKIDESYHTRLTLHQTPELIGDSEGCYNVGFQINSRHPVAPEGTAIVSKSCHSVEEVLEAASDPQIRYQTLSPIFDSLSKPGYRSRFSEAELRNLPPGTIALGVGTPDRCEMLRDIGFDGVAMLGYVWRSQT